MDKRVRRKKHSSSSDYGRVTKRHKLDRAMSFEETGGEEEDDELWEDGESEGSGRGETPLNHDNETILKDEIKLAVKVGSFFSVLLIILCNFIAIVFFLI